MIKVNVERDKYVRPIITPMAKISRDIGFEKGDAPHSSGWTAKMNLGRVKQAAERFGRAYGVSASPF